MHFCLLLQITQAESHHCAQTLLMQMYAIQNHTYNHFMGEFHILKNYSALLWAIVYSGGGEEEKKK